MKGRLTPAKIGIAAAAVAALLVLIGVLLGNVPPNPRAIAVALLVGSGAWGIVAWVLAETAWEVEAALQESREEGDEEP